LGHASENRRDGAVVRGDGKDCQRVVLRADSSRVRLTANAFHFYIFQNIIFFFYSLKYTNQLPSRGLVKIGGVIRLVHPLW